VTKQGYPGALEAVRELSGCLGIAPVSVTNAFDPQVIVVGAGLAAWQAFDQAGA
jgi:predicted NBD/HSP70 family sugar kinase